MSESSGEAPERTTLERADALLDLIARGVVLVPSMVGTGIARVVAYGREGAEDLWADAQNVRRRAATSESNGSPRIGLAEYTDMAPERRVQADTENSAQEAAASAAARPRQWPRTYGSKTTTFGRVRSTTFGR